MTSHSDPSHDHELAVSVAYETGLWGSPGLWAPSSAAADKAFSSVTLAGAMTSASVVSRQRPPDLAESLARHLAEAAPLGVAGVEQVDRDIDGSTVVCRFPLSARPDWTTLAEIADATVAWADEDAPDVRARRVALGCQPLDEIGAARPATALWSHSILLCRRAGLDPAHACDEAVARALLPSEFETVPVRGTVVHLGLHASLVCTADRAAGARVVALLDELHGWWTATWALDQVLLSTAERLSSVLADADYDDLSASADLLATVTTRTGLLESRLDSFRLSLGGFDWPLWDAAGRRWAIQENFEALSRKREVLAEMTAAFRSALELHHAARLNQLAGIFAVVSALASFVAVCLFLFPTLQDSTSTPLRVVLVIACLAISATALVWSSHFMLRMARRRHRRPTQSRAQNGSQ